MNQRMTFATAIFVILACSALGVHAGTNGEAIKRKDTGSESVQRGTPGLFDQKGNVVSSISFQTTNYGIFGFDVRNGRGGTFWPSGRNNQYIFAGGMWLGVRKKIGNEIRKRVMIGYNPNSGLSWMVPGTIEDGLSINTTSDGINKFRTYFSPDFNTTDGTEFANPTFPRWPIWDSSPNDTVRFNNYYGYYVNDPTSRYKTTYPKGPAFISEEDIFCVYKDTDLNYYEGGTSKRKSEGFPLGIQVEQMIYSWGFGDYADFLFLKYMIIHPNQYKDTLFDCWMAAVQDVDIALITNAAFGAGNDRARYYDEDPQLNLAVQWSNTDRLEAGQGFGYLGFSFLESPAVSRDTSLNAVHFSDGSNGFVVGNRGRILETSNAGKQWISRTNASIKDNLFDVAFADANVGWVVGDNATIAKTTDRGLSWSRQMSASVAEYRGIHVANSSTAWVAGGDTTGGVILKTVDGGSVWTPQNTGTVLPLYSVSFADDLRGWAVGKGSTILATVDGGTTWTVQANPDTTTLRAVHAVSQTNAFAVGDNPAFWSKTPDNRDTLIQLPARVLRTVDGGATWTSTALSDADIFPSLDVRMIDSQRGYIVGRNGFIHKTADGGNSWTPVDIKVTSNLNSLYFATSMAGSIVSDFGRIYSSVDGGDSWSLQRDDTTGYIRTDKNQFANTDQLGLRTMRNWPITEDPIENEDRYNFISSTRLDNDLGPGDRRLMMATGPFNFRPGDSARIVVGIILAPPVGTEATGTTADLTELIRKVKFAQFVYDNQFRAPRAPDLTVIKGAPRGSTSGLNNFLVVPPEGFLPLNNAIVIQWDSTSEMSVDTLERGLDFFGYRIYRARRTDLDTFNVDFQKNARKGPLGWKQIGQFQMNAPFVKEGATIGTTGVRLESFTIADVIKPGQKRFMVLRLPSNAPPWGNYFTSLVNSRNASYGLVINPTDSTIITSGTRPGIGIPFFDKLDSIRFTYFTTVIETLPTVGRTGARLTLDTVAAKVAKDSLVKLILARRVKMDPVKFNDVDTIEGENGTKSFVSSKRPWEETNEVRKGFIAGYMRQITNGRVFFDYGDDNGNGAVTATSDPATSEKLVNNMDYFYAIRAYDEGDYLLPTTQKLNNRSAGLSNTVTATPLAARPGDAASFSLTTDEKNRARLGGIYNVRLLVNDQQRFNQMFGGRTLELEFFRQWTGLNEVQNSTQPGVGLYGTIFFLRDSATRNVLNTWSSFLPPEICPFTNVPGFSGYFSENSAVYVDSSGVLYDTVFSNSGQVVRIDTTTFGLPDSREKVIRSGGWTSDAACFTNKYAFGTIGLAFDYAMEQWGGVYRSDSAKVVVGPENYVLSPSNLSAAVFDNSNFLNPPPPYIDLPPGFISNFPWSTSYNNGPGIYEVTFKDGATETIETEFEVGTTRDSTITFRDVPYLTYEIKNVYSFDRADPRPDGTVGSVPVRYDLPLVPQILGYNSIPPAVQLQFPNPQPIRVGNYTSAAYGWRNSRTSDFRITTMSKLAAESNGGKPIGSENRYYLSRTLSTGGGDTLDFTHVIAFAGAQFVLDFATMGRIRSNRTVVARPPSGTNLPKIYATQDFKPGDKIRLSTFGGVFGFPADSAKAYIKVANYDKFDLASSSQSYSDSDLEQVQVVPNPFYVTHEGMQSPFQSIIYFTRLPRICTISIFSTNGALIKKFEHNETNGVTPDKAGADVWDLLSTNRQRAVSQLLIAKIETPEGASVIRKFSIVVGPARVIGD